jgi:hypothetical protein
MTKKELFEAFKDVPDDTEVVTVLRTEFDPAPCYMFVDTVEKNSKIYTGEVLPAVIVLSTDGF